jgi:hypothetical protein
LTPEVALQDFRRLRPNDGNPNTVNCVSILYAVAVLVAFDHCPQRGFDTVANF